MRMIMMEKMNTLPEMTDDELLDLYEIHCARHGRMHENDEQTHSIIPLRAEVKRRISSRIY